MQLCNRIYYSKVQHVSSGTPLIIRRSKLYLQPLVYILINFGIINSITKLHLVGICIESPTIHGSTNIKFINAKQAIDIHA